MGRLFSEIRYAEICDKFLDLLDLLDPSLQYENTQCDVFKGDIKKDYESGALYDRVSECFNLFAGEACRVTDEK